MSEFTQETLDEVVRLGRITGDPKIVTQGNISFAVIPNDTKIESLERFVYNEHAAAPDRMKGTVTVLDPESFIEYYTLFHDANSRIFAFEPNISVTGILDYHGAADGGPRWCGHRVKLTLRESPEWTAWTGMNNKQFDQMKFAEFLEQNSMDITKPTPAEMVDLSRDLQGKTEVEFGGGVRTGNGQVQFKYTESTKATVGGGAVTVPEQFVITLPVFVGGGRINMQALLRYRVKEGKIIFWYTLVRPEEVKRLAFIASREVIASGLKAAIINGEA